MKQNKYEIPIKYVTERVTILLHILWLFDQYCLIRMTILYLLYS